MNLFRITDFFELGQTLRTGKLRVPSAARFSDPNELIGNLFSALADPRISPKTEAGVQQLIRDQGALRQCHYVSCWTRMKDSVAMWEIYSPDQTSAQIEVDERCLRGIFDDFYRNNASTLGHKKPPSCDETYFSPPNIGDCEYEDLAALAENMRKKTRSNQARAFDALDKQGIDEYLKIFDETSTEASNISLKLFYVKDHAYAHEREVRFCLNAVRRNDRVYDDCKNDFGFILFDTHLRPSTIDEVGDNIFIDFPASAIRHVWLDCRAPNWLTDVQQGVLKDHGVDSTRSEAYGAFVNHQSVQKWWD